jgi:hypothetical protein
MPFVVPACLLIAWLVVGSSAGVAGRVRGYQRMPARYRADPAAIARSAGLHHALVFVNEDSRSRTLHRLWSLGIGRGNAARLIDSAPVCAVRVAIDAELSMVPPRSDGRLERLIQHATTVDSTAVSSRGCQEDARRDAEGWATYMPFFAANEVGPDGRLGGDVVYALDLGEHNEVLRSRFGDRAWYRFGARSVSKDTLPVPIPYDVPAR